MHYNRARFNFLWGGTVASLGVTGFFSLPALAQIVPDDTLGAEGSRVSPNVLIRGALGDRIDGGALRSSNLFHSFSQFNVNDGQRVYFANPAGIENILSRVTGGDVSDIMGTLGVDGGANLYLLNPNGIIFGPNAQLDVGGAFVATTASALQFGGQGFFSATNPEAPPLLTVRPSAFFFNQSGIAGITSSAGLQVPIGQNLLLVGGNVDLTGGSLTAPGGRIGIAGLAAPGTIGLNADASFSLPDRVERAELSFAGASVNVASDQGGDVEIAGRNLSFTNSSVQAGIALNSGFPDSQAGNLTVNATDTITVDNSRLSSDVYNRVVGNAGNLSITTGSLSVTNGASLTAITYGQGDAGNIVIEARDRISLDGTTSDGQFVSGIFSTVAQTGRGRGGNIRLFTGTLSLTNGAGLSAITSGQGDAGNVVIEARDRIFLDGTTSDGQFVSGIFSTVAQTGRGRGGNIRLFTGTLSLTNGAGLSASTSGQGDAGDIVINVRDRISLANGTTLNSEANIGNSETNTSRAGDIFVDTDVLVARAGSYLSSSTYNSGDGGNVIINARIVEFDGLNQDNFIIGNFPRGFTGAYSTSEGGRNDIGNGGRVEINAEQLFVHNQAEVATRTFSGGNAGDLVIRAGTLSLTNGAGLTAESFGQGSAGNIRIIARTVRLDRGTVTARTGVGTGGSVTLSGINQLILRNNSQISAEANGTARGGNITINTSETQGGFIIGLPRSNSDIVATASEGQGGEINVYVDRVLGFEIQDQANLEMLRRNSTNDISASSASGPQGVVNIQTLNVDPSQGLAELPTNLVDASQQIAAGCGLGNNSDENEFIVTGRGGLPPNSGDPLTASAVDVPWVVADDVAPNNVAPNNVAPNNVAPNNVVGLSATATDAPLVEAQGMWVDAEGNIHLVAEVETELTANPTAIASQFCAVSSH